MDKINKVIFALPNMASGGAERVVAILANQIVSKDIAVEIWLYYGKILHYNLDSRIGVKCLQMSNSSIFKRTLILRRLLNVEKKKYKLVFVPFLSSVLNISIFANLTVGIPLVACERNNPYLKGMGYFRKLINELPFMLADHCVFQTQDAREYYSRVRNKRCSILVNPVSPSSIYWNGIVDPSKLISVCRLHKQKNLYMTLDVISILKKKYKDVHVDIYGDGELRDVIELEIKSRDLIGNVSLKGVSKDINSLLAKSSIFISTSDYEGISNSMLEAMSVGMPLVCTDCPIGGAAYMLKDGAGVLTPVRDAVAFAKAVSDLLDNASHAVEIGLKAKETIKLYTPEMISNKWLSIFNSLIK